MCLTRTYALGLVASVALLSPSLAWAQRCTGVPTPTLGAAIHRTEGAKSLAFLMLPTRGTGVFFLGWQKRWIDGVDKVPWVLEVGGGADIDAGGKGRVFVCPIASYAYSSDTRDQTSTNIVGGGVHIGVVAFRSRAVTLVPTVGMVVAFARVSTTLCCFKPATSRGQVATLGVGAQFFGGRFTVRPSVSIPVAADDTERKSFGVYFGVSQPKR